MIWIVFAAAAVLTLIGRKSFVFDVFAAVLCVFGFLFGLYSGLGTAELVPPATLFCAAALTRKAGDAD